MTVHGETRKFAPTASEDRSTLNFGRCQRVGIQRLTQYGHGNEKHLQSKRRSPTVPIWRGSCVPLG
jgi:hypothetical protein